jgi:hypothetical protein
MMKGKESFPLSYAGPGKAKKARRDKPNQTCRESTLGQSTSPNREPPSMNVTVRFEELARQKKSLESLLMEANEFNKAMLQEVQRLKEEQGRVRDTSVHCEQERSRLTRTIERLKESREDFSQQPRKNLEQKILHYFKELE